MSRNKQRLSQDANAVRSSCPAGVDVQGIIMDAASATSVKQALHQAEHCLATAETQLECALYNSARPGTSYFSDFTAEELEADLRVCITSLYTVAACSIPQLLTIASTAGKTPSLLVTSGMLAKDPFAAVFPLASSKAGQNSLVHALHKELKSKGVHCALLVVGGTVAEDSAVTNPRNIAEETWKLFRQPQGQGHLALFLDDPAYGGHFKRRGKA